MPKDLLQAYSAVLSSLHHDDKYLVSILADSFVYQLEQQQLRRGISKQELAAQYGRSIVRIHQILAGRNFTLRTMVRLAKIVGCGVEVKLVPKTEGE